ncbi:hypothetical protein PGAL8A_00000700 [Plasmodium gallinaceum]|uniref:Uncharacterized protein n=1 Tax=Plasmodium gallinaceum TaxID=5849 RepID=A0A1J1GL70_PLAGA|nr:hypothetical protein PGAL8A_00000700 [Plasmodium gallinaceum]CRG93067.1 hypothetical protein PGAL8A_00000700 [Plasmodium gallinaceum]
MESEENYDPHSFEDDDYIKNSHVTIRLNAQDNCDANLPNLPIPNQSEILIEEQNVIINNSPENQGVYIRNNRPGDYMGSFLCSVAFYSTLFFFTIRHLLLNCYRGFRRYNRERSDNDNCNTEQKNHTSNVNNEEA